MIAHHTENGCNLRPGDLLGTGTQSGPTRGEEGCLLELTRGGKEPLTLPDGETRSFLHDGDTVVLRGWCERAGSCAHRIRRMPRHGAARSRSRSGDAVAWMTGCRTRPFPLQRIRLLHIEAKVVQRNRQPPRRQSSHTPGDMATADSFFSSLRSGRHLRALGSPPT